MGYLRDLLVGAAGSLLAAEAYVHADPLARWIVRMAVTRLPADEQERSLEAWLADLNDMPGSIRKLLWAIGCHRAATVTNVRAWRAVHPVTLRSAINRWNARATEMKPRNRFVTLAIGGMVLGGATDSVWEVTRWSPSAMLVSGFICGAICYVVNLIFRPRRAGLPRA
jgi:hypothetical protein